MENNPGVEANFGIEDQVVLEVTSKIRQTLIEFDNEILSRESDMVEPEREDFDARLKYAVEMASLSGQRAALSRALGAVSTIISYEQIDQKGIEKDK